MSSLAVAVAAIWGPNCSKLALFQGQQMATLARSYFSRLKFVPLFTIYTFIWRLHRTRDPEVALTCKAYIYFRGTPRLFCTCVRLFYGCLLPCLAGQAGEVVAIRPKPPPAGENAKWRMNAEKEMISRPVERDLGYVKWWKTGMSRMIRFSCPVVVQTVIGSFYNRAIFGSGTKPQIIFLRPNDKLTGRNHFCVKFEKGSLFLSQILWSLSLLSLFHVQI